MGYSLQRGEIVLNLRWIHDTKRALWQSSRKMLKASINFIWKKHGKRMLSPLNWLLPTHKWNTKIILYFSWAFSTIYKNTNLDLIWYFHKYSARNNIEFQYRLDNKTLLLSKSRHKMCTFNNQKEIRNICQCFKCVLICCTSFVAYNLHAADRTQWIKRQHAPTIYR